jgi:competence ComEA-like helix-hairpin-helix protein
MNLALSDGPIKDGTRRCRTPSRLAPIGYRVALKRPASSRMTNDERRAVGFLAVLLLLALVARFVNRPSPITIQAAPVDLAALRAAGQSLRQQAAPAARTRSKPHRPEPRATPVYVEDPGPLDINRASLEDFDRLPGIGPAVAQRIIARRDSIGRFRRIEELDSVKGIGPALLEKIRPLVTIK